MDVEYNNGLLQRLTNILFPIPKLGPQNPPIHSLPIGLCPPKAGPNLTLIQV